MRIITNQRERTNSKEELVCNSNITNNDLRVCASQITIIKVIEYTHARLEGSKGSKEKDSMFSA